MKARVLWQSCVVATAGYLASGVSFAQSSVDCSSVAEDMARLKCYDEQAARQKKTASQATTTAPTTSAPPATVAPSAAADPSARAAAPAPPAASSDFGLDPEAVRRKQASSNPESPREPEQLVARVKAVSAKARGEYRITLEDGQVWEETQHSSATIPPEVGETVTIRRGMLGSYFLAHSAGLALRVKRIR